MQPFLVYSTTNGQILRTGAAPSHLVAYQAGPGEALLNQSADPNRFYVRNGEITPRPTLPNPTRPFLQADGVDELAINGLPEGSTVTIADQVFELTDNSFVFSIDEPGAYQVLVEPPFPFVPRTYMITAL